MRMRIISGEYKGRFIKVPDSKLIRPTTDRVRETLFNLINNRFDFTNAKVLDFYAGSGSLGLECLSRGASEIHFVEKNFVIYKNLEENIKSLEAEEKCKVFKLDAVKFTETFKNNRYDLILADPPFFKDDIYKVAENVLNINMLNDEDSLFIIERSIQTRIKDVEHFRMEPFKVIGDTCLYQFSKI
jgi:16S rRNA (guanine966-N2)-methyltransferase